MRISNFRGFKIEQQSKYFLVYYPNNKFFGRYSRYTHVIGSIIAAWQREHGVRD